MNKTTSETSTTSKKITTTRPRSLTWTAVEPAPRPRWWLFVIVGYFAPVLAVICFAIGNLSLGLVVAVFGVMFFVVYLPRPKRWHYELLEDTLHATCEHHRGPADELHLKLENYKDAVANTIVTPGGERVVITLLPSHRLGSDVDIYLPETETTAGVVKRVLLQVVPWS